MVTECPAEWRAPPDHMAEDPKFTTKYRGGEGEALAPLGAGPGLLHVGGARRGTRFPPSTHPTLHHLVTEMLNVGFQKN